MSTPVEIAKNALDEFTLLQEFMISAKNEGAKDTYSKLKDRYLTLKALLNICGVNLSGIDKMKE